MKSDQDLTLYVVACAAAWRRARVIAIEEANPETCSQLARAEADLSDAVRNLESA